VNFIRTWFFTFTENIAFVHVKSIIFIKVLDKLRLYVDKKMIISPCWYFGEILGIFQKVWDYF
jgi:hypothetical protein